MTTALPELDTEVLNIIREQSNDGSRALDLIMHFRTHPESDIQKVIAKLLTDGRIRFTHSRRLKLAENDRSLVTKP